MSEATRIDTTNPGQLKKILAAALINQFPVLIVGAPGIGKSDIITKAAAEAGADLEIMHPVVSSPVDFKGLPYVGNGEVAKYLPDGQLNRLITADKPTVCFMDDLGQAPAAVQAACMQLILARRVNGHKVSDHVTFLAATNRREDGAGVNGILEPVKSRYMSILHLEANVDDWSRWALKNNMPMELIAFVRYRPDKLVEGKPSRDMVNTPSPRTVAALGKWINAGVDNMAVWAGAVGQGFATEFSAFLKVWKKLPRFSKIVADPHGTRLPEATEPSVTYATVGMLVKNVKEENIDSVFAYLRRMPDEFQVLFAKDMVLAKEDLADTQAYVSWAVDKGSII